MSLIESYKVHSNQDSKAHRRRQRESSLYQYFTVFHHYMIPCKENRPRIFEESQRNTSAKDFESPDQL